MMGNLHPNTKSSTIVHIAKLFNVVEHVCQAFQEEKGVTPNKEYSSVPTFENDFQKILKQIEDDFFSSFNHLTAWLQKQKVSKQYEMDKHH